MNIFYHFYQIIVVPIEVGFIGIVGDCTNLLIETHIQSYSIILDTKSFLSLCVVNHPPSKYFERRTEISPSPHYYKYAK